MCTLCSCTSTYEGAHRNDGKIIFIYIFAFRYTSGWVSLVLLKMMMTKIPMRNKQLIEFVWLVTAEETFWACGILWPITFTENDFIFNADELNLDAIVFCSFLVNFI